MIYFQFWYIVYFPCSKATELILEAQVKLFLEESVYVHYNFKMPELLSSKPTLTYGL